MPFSNPKGGGTSIESRARTGTPSERWGRFAYFEGITTARLFPILRTGPTTSISAM